jgi:hypothetical protein
MATNFKTIRAAIKTAIDTATKVQAAYTYERSTFEGFPAVIIAPSENEADYGSTQKDRLVFIFKVRAFYPIPDEGEHSDAETALEEVVDELLTIFKSRDAIGSACDWVEPAPGSWYYEERGEAVYRVAEITLRCVKYVA